MSVKKDLFQYLELYSPESEIIPLSMGAPGPSTLKGCSEVLMEATRITLVRLCFSCTYNLKTVDVLILDLEVARFFLRLFATTDMYPYAVKLS